jgi:hypothetical protein
VGRLEPPARAFPGLERLLRQRLGDTWLGKLKNKSFYLRALYPLMRGRKDGEVNIYLIKKR